jgi:hypothetical protein
MARQPWSFWLAVLLAPGLIAVGLRWRRFPWILVLLGVCALVMRIPRLLQWPESKLHPTLVVGFDGATWEQLDPLLDAGELPALQQLLTLGTRLPLRSEEPTMSPRVWTSIATGVTPEEHGIRDFQSSRQDLRVGRVWDAVTAQGEAVGLMSWLMTWPPDPVPGFCVPGWTARSPLTQPPEASFVKILEQAGKGDRGFATWDGLQALFSATAVCRADELLEAVQSLAQCLFAPARGKELYWRFKLLQARLQTRLFLELLQRERPVFSALVLYSTDTLAHKYWRYHEPAAFPSVEANETEQFGEVVREAYRQSDQALGTLMQRIDLQQVRLVLVSDHGMQAMAEDRLSQNCRIQQDRLLQLLPQGAGLRAVTVTRSLVLTPMKTGEEGRQLLHRVSQTLSSARNSVRECAIFRVEASIEEEGLIRVFPELADTEPQDLLTIAENSIPAEELFRVEKRSGVHHPVGILSLAGPGIRTGVSLPEAPLRDVAPTLLHLLGLPVPESLPGQPIAEAFQPQWLASNPVQPTAVPLTVPAPPDPSQSGDETLLKEQLRALGYIE